MKKRLITVLSVILTFLMLGGTFSFAANVSPVKVDQFTDVSAQDWYYDYVDFVSQNAYMIGTSETTFEPQSDLTRAMFATILARYDKAVVDDSKATIFNDVPVDQWYTGSIGWANENAIVQGYGDGKFGTNDPITRQDLALMIIRYIRFYEKEHKVKIKTHGGEWKGDITFTDESDIRQDVETPAAIKDLVNYGILLGYPDGTVKPTQRITRAETAAVIKRLDWILTPKPGPGSDQTQYYQVKVDINTPIKSGSLESISGSLESMVHSDTDSLAAETIMEELFSGNNQTKLQNAIETVYADLEAVHNKVVRLENGDVYEVTAQNVGGEIVITATKNGNPVTKEEWEQQLQVEEDLYNKVLIKKFVPNSKLAGNEDAASAWEKAVNVLSPKELLTVDTDSLKLLPAKDYVAAASTAAKELGKVMDSLGPDFDDFWSEVIAADTGIIAFDSDDSLASKELAAELGKSNGNVINPFTGNNNVVLEVSQPPEGFLLNMINTRISRDWESQPEDVSAIVAFLKAVELDVDSKLNGPYSIKATVVEVK